MVNAVIIIHKVLIAVMAQHTGTELAMSLLKTNSVLLSEIPLVMNMALLLTISNSNIPSGTIQHLKTTNM